MLYKISMRQTNVFRKTIIVEASDESAARRAAFVQDNGQYERDPSERRRRFIDAISLVTVDDLTLDS